MLANLPLRFLVVTASLGGLLFVGSCTQEVPPTGPEVFSVEFAKGGNGNGGGGSSGDPVVRDTDPPGTEQGTVDLQVRILGSGFEHPAHVRFLMDGDTSGIATSDTADFISSSELITTITVDADAELGLWDVEVELLSNRRKGIGIELFAVVADFFVGFQGALETSSEEAVTKDLDTRLELTVSSDSYRVAANFINTVTYYGSRLNFVEPDVDIPDGEPNGNCWVRHPDLAEFDASVTPQGIAAILMNTLTFDGSRPRELKNLTVDKRHLGEQYANHAVRLMVGNDDGSLLDENGKLIDLSTNPVNPFQWGQNSAPSGDFPRIDLVSGAINDASTTRVFDMSEGIVRVVGRLGSAGSDPLVELLCDVHPDDTARVTIQPNAQSTPGKKR